MGDMNCINQTFFCGKPRIQERDVSQIRFGLNKTFKSEKPNMIIVNGKRQFGVIYPFLSIQRDVGIACKIKWK